MMVCGFDTCIVLNRAGDKSGMKRSIIDHINELRNKYALNPSDSARNSGD